MQFGGFTLFYLIVGTGPHWTVFFTPLEELLQFRMLTWKSLKSGRTNNAEKLKACGTIELHIN